MMRLGACIAVLAAAASAQAPRVAMVTPAGGCRGSEITVELRGERLAAPLGVWFDGPGIELLAVDAADARRGAMTLRIAADCPLGRHALRVHTACGLSNLVPFHVGALPSVPAAPAPGAPMLLPGPCTVDGVLAADPVRFQLAADAAVPLCVEVEAHRLGLAALDTLLIVRAADGRELARADDTPLGGRDPWLLVTPETAGVIEIELAPAVPATAASGAYRLHVAPVPRPYGALPAGGRPGEELAVVLLGAERLGTERVRLPDDGRDRFAWVPELPAGAPPSAIWLEVGDHPNCDGARDAAGRLELPVPGAVHGVLADGTPATFRWAGRKGVETEFRVAARGLRSALDPVLAVLTSNGRQLASNDDAAGLDSVLRFTPEADGEFSVEVRDLLGRGSPQHFFRLTAGPRQRPRRLAMQVGRNRDPVVHVPQGQSAVAVLARTGLGAGEPVAISGLPAGVDVRIGPLLPGSAQVFALFTADANAPLAAATLQLGSGDASALDTRPFQQSVTLLAGRNDVPIEVAAQRGLPLAVTAPAPFAASAAAGCVPVIRGARATVPLILHRTAGFDDRARVRGAFAPPGITVGQTAFERRATDASLTIEAGTSAPLGSMPVLLIVEAQIGNVPVESALALELRIDEPWSTVASDRTRGRQGGSAALRLAVTDRLPRRAAATARLAALPRGVAAPELVLAPDERELRFELTIASDAPPGRHQGIAVELWLLGEDDQPVLHSFPAGELRIAPAIRGGPP